MFNRGKNRVVLFAAFVCMALVGEGAFAKPKSELVKEESGYYYGYGKGATTEEADFLAKRDLIENALTSTLRITNPEAGKISISDDLVAKRLTDVKAYTQSKNGLSVTYRVRVSEWERDEKAYAAKLRTSLSSRYNTLIGKGSIASRIDSAISILNELAENGETDLLTVQEKGSELYSLKVEDLCSSLISELTYSFSVKDSIIKYGTPIEVTVKDRSGKGVADLSLKALWEFAYLPITTDIPEDAEESVSYVKTDKSGVARIDFPIAEQFQGQAVNLTVSVAFAAGDKTTEVMRKLDGASSTDARYVCYKDLADAYTVINVKAGTYKTGSVATDARANPKEEPRSVKVKAYALGAAPVTNAQYAFYLFLTRSEENPEYFDNSDYNLAKQPVVGVSVADAENYAEWLSKQIGGTFRLPSDDEWEIAARADTENIYPWGDDNPSKSKKANYKGNGKYKFPSPVGEFVDSTNSWGFVDMAGNVWEWTTTARGESSGSDARTVKGGSWMDGPVDLRISNYKNLDKESKNPDVGFRLVKEVAK